MDFDEKIRWNKRYSERERRPSAPDPFLVTAYSKFLSGRGPGMALDLAGGAGRHAIWLGERGWNVTLLDISDVGLRLARKNADEKLLPAGSLQPAVVDLTSVTTLGDSKYDLVMVFFYLQRELFPALVTALKPGGLLLYKTFTTEQAHFQEGPRDPRFLLAPDELRSAFPGLELLHYRESRDENAVAELAGVKPPL